MTARRNAWLSLSLDMMRLGVEAQSVIGLRLLKAAWGGADGGAEARLMVAEKAQAIFDTNAMLARSLLTGEGHLAAARTTALYRRRVKANHRRLARGG